MVLRVWTNISVISLHVVKFIATSLYVATIVWWKYRFPFQNRCNYIQDVNDADVIVSRILTPPAMLEVFVWWRNVVSQISVWLQKYWMRNFKHLVIRIRQFFCDILIVWSHEEYLQDGGVFNP